MHWQLFQALSLEHFMIFLSLLSNWASWWDCCFLTTTTAGISYHHQRHSEGKKSRRLSEKTWLSLTHQVALEGRRSFGHNAFARCCNKSAVFSVIINDSTVWLNISMWWANEISSPMLHGPVMIVIIQNTVTCDKSFQGLANEFLLEATGVTRERTHAHTHVHSRYAPLLFYSELLEFRTLD